MHMQTLNDSGYLTHGRYLDCLAYVVLTNASCHHIYSVCIWWQSENTRKCEDCSRVC